MAHNGNVSLLEQEQALLWDQISASGFISSPNPSGHIRVSRAPQWWKKWQRWDAFLGPFLSSIQFCSCVCTCYRNPAARMEKPIQVSKKKKKNCHWEPGQLQQLRDGSLVWQYKYKQFNSRKDAGTPLRLQVARESREQKLNCLFCLEQAQKVEQISFPSYLGEVAELQPHFFVLRESTVKWHHSKPSYIPGLFSNHHSKLPFFFSPLPVLPPLSSNFCF